MKRFLILFLLIINCISFSNYKPDLNLISSSVALDIKRSFWRNTYRYTYDNGIKGEVKVKGGWSKGKSLWVLGVKSEKKEIHYKVTDEMNNLIWNVTVYTYRKSFNIEGEDYSVDFGLDNSLEVEVKDREGEVRFKGFRIKDGDRNEEVFLFVDHGTYIKASFNSYEVSYRFYNREDELIGLVWQDGFLRYSGGVVNNPDGLSFNEIVMLFSLTVEVVNITEEL